MLPSFTKSRQGASTSIPITWEWIIGSASFLHPSIQILYWKYILHHSNKHVITYTSFIITTRKMLLQKCAHCHSQNKLKILNKILRAT